MSVTDDQQFCLRWNNFQAYITSQFEALRDDEDFVDVTLACEGQRLGAHKVVLSACSPFFKELFKTNPCPHPIIFMRDVEVRHVIALLEFMYAGEVNVAQAQLAGFLRTAESLQIRGLTDASKNHKDNDDLLYTESQPTSTQFSSQSHSSPPIRNTVLKPKQYIAKTPQQQQQHSPSRAVTSTQEKLQEELSLLSPPPCKKTCKTDSESDRLDKMSDTADVEHTEETKSYSSQINPFAIQSNNKALHSEIDITTELLEPKLELPDYSEDDTNNENSHSFMDVHEGPNAFTALPGGMEIIPGTSGMGDISQESQQGPADGARSRGKTRACRRRSDSQWLHLPLALDMASSAPSTQAADRVISRFVGWRGREGHSGGRVVKLGEGIEICEEQLRSVKWSDYRKLTRGLATILFSPMELATCSVTGQRWSRAGNGERPVKPALDRAKVQAIISYVATRFPMVEISRIKQVLAYKCKENSTAFKMKAIRYFGDQQIRPQNQ
ncbi:broad [Carabus blaptoides fortunei]